MQDHAVIFLVHGTFAPGAAWTRPQSDLCQALEATTRAAGYLAVFETIEWGGRNTSQARIEGARTLDTQFRSACEKFPAAPIFLIGHSHGGSVIAYFYRALADGLRKRVTGSAFLSTPFIAARVRPDWRQLTAGLGIALAVLVFTALVALTSYIDFLNQWSYKDKIPFHITALLGGFCLICLLAAEAVRRATVRWGERITKNLPAVVAVRETARLPVGRHIFLRATGDEAAAFLVFGQFAMWALSKLQVTVSDGIGRVWNAVVRSRLLSAVAGIVGVLYAVWVGTEVAIMLDPKVHFRWTDLFARPLVPIGHLQGFTEVSIQILAGPFVLLFVSMILFIVFLLIAIALCLVALRIAGWFSVKDGLFAEIAVEPVPLGEVALLHLDWNVDAPSVERRHSYSHSNPNAVRCITEWIAGSLRR